MTSLADIARQAGVSESTASRALNHPELLSPEVVARVRALAKQLGYVPNPFARSLRVQESKTLGLIVPDNTNPFFAEVARGIEAACFRAGYTLILCNSDRSLEKEAAQARVLYEKRVDGVLFFNTSDASSPTIEWLLHRSLPVVLVERRSPGPPVDSVISDNAAGVRQAVEHLAGLGHRRLACLVGDTAASHYAERVAAFWKAVRDLGLDGGDIGPPAGAPGSEAPTPRALEEAQALVRTGLITYADGLRAAADLLAADWPPTALLCATDTLAIGAIRGAAARGLRVPQDVAVVGYGNTEVTAYTQPPLTSVGQEKLAVGARAVRVLLRRIAQRAAGQQRRPRTYVVPTRLVIRESTVEPHADARRAAKEFAS